VTSRVAVDKGVMARWHEALSRYRRARSGETGNWDARYEALGGNILKSDLP